MKMINLSWFGDFRDRRFDIRPSKRTLGDFIYAKTSSLSSTPL